MPWSAGRVKSTVSCEMDHCTFEKTFGAGRASGSLGVASEQQQSIGHLQFVQAGSLAGEYGRIICGHITANASRTANNRFTYLLSACLRKLQLNHVWRKPG